VPNPQTGTILDAYRVEGTLGAGSMGEVFKGIDTGLQRRVAIKILSEKHRDSPELRARFVREGRAVAAIQHPNVVQVFATGTWDGRPYIAMELLDGTDLGSTVEKRGPLDSVSAAHAILDAAQGLNAAAKAGLIHRDVKPSNLVRLSDGKVKVTDFGLAKPVDPGSEPALTAMGVVVGTPDYIAPEQARGETIDERVDIYALGGTMYFVLTGMPPFRTGKPAEDKYLKVVARHLRNPAPDAAQTNPGVDKELSDLTRAMMAKKPHERPGYEELIARLTDILGRIDPDAVPSLIASRERSRPNLIPRELRENEGVRSSSDSVADMLPPRAFPIWLVVLTFLSIATFVAGLVVYLRRVEPGEINGGTPPPPADAAVSVAPDASAPPQPSPGQLVVKKKDGGVFYADAKPVSLAAFQKVFTKHDQKGNPEDPAIVSYKEAKAFAETSKGRLLSVEEWDAAAAEKGFVNGDLFEWIASVDDKEKTVHKRGTTEKRAGADQKYKDVTFRVGRDAK
jgi:serine/threonine-protein kinase